MNLEQFKATVPHPLRVVTLVLLARDGQVVLAQKKEGFGRNKWNGFGGKVKEGETVWQCAMRETQEECEVQPNWLRRVAYLNFYFCDIPLEANWNQQAHVFIAGSWSGRPAETDEMHCPQTFAINELPLEQMWLFDREWMPRVLAGEQLTGDFLFAGEGEPVEHKFSPFLE